jgi:O-antigen/teichoic acid export membrane protein
MPRFRRVLLANMGMAMASAGVLATGIALASPWILRMYGKEFEALWDILVVMAFTAVMESAMTVVQQVLFSLGRMWHFFWINVLWVGLLVGGSAVLVPRYGVRGYVWAAAVAMAANAVAQTVLAWRVLRRQTPPPVSPT